MKTLMLRSAHGIESDATAISDAIALLAGLGAKIVDRCGSRCEICGPVLDAAA